MDDKWVEKRRGQERNERNGRQMEIDGGKKERMGKKGEEWKIKRVERKRRKKRK